jgi:DNA-binding Lrp family transcriptional regulator
LTYTLISELTSLSIETVRRQVKKLEENNWVSYSKKEGVKYNPNEENNNFLAGNFNVMEVEGLGQLLDVIEQKTTSKE